MQEPRAILDGLAHADNAAAADLHAGVPHMGKRVEPVLIGPRGDDLAVELGRRIEIMVVGREPGLGEAAGLILGQHAEGDAGLHVQRADAPHHGEHAVEGLAVLHLAPGRAHAEARGPRLFGDPGLGQHVVHVEQCLALEPGLLGVVSRLRAVLAVLRTGPGLDGKQAGKLHLAVRVVAPVDAARLVHEVEQGGREQADDLVGAPIVAGAGRAILLRAASPPGGPCR